MKNSEKPINAIFNEYGKISHQSTLENNSPSQCLQGLTKRECFAAMAMQGLLSNPLISDIFTTDNGVPLHKSVAENSIQYADELLKQLENGK